MSKFDDNIELYKKAFTTKLKRKKINENLLRAIAKSLGPSIYNKDAAKVACSDKKELTKIKSSFLIGKLGLEDGPALDEAIKEVCKSFGSSNRNKYRAVFYYLLVEKFEKQGMYQTAQDSVSETIKTSKKKAVMKKGKTKGKTSDEIIKDYAFYAAGAGFVPIPVLDLVSISAVQYKMIKKLSGLYDHVTFKEEKAKFMIAGLMGGTSSFELGIIARFLFKGIPFFGPIIGGTAMSGFAYVTTKLIGEIFDEHFASGGNFSIEELTMQKMKETFKFEISRNKPAS